MFKTQKLENKSGLHLYESKVQTISKKSKNYQKSIYKLIILIKNLKIEEKS